IIIPFRGLSKLAAGHRRSLRFDERDIVPKPLVKKCSSSTAPMRLKHGSHPPAQADMEKGRCWRPFHEFGPVSRTRTFATSAGRCVQAEGCPVKTITFPLFETQTEISL